MPFLADTFGNPSASHRWGREARRALDDARDTMAEVLGAQPGEVVFTSGGTEADNQAIVGVLAAPVASPCAPRSSTTPCSSRSSGRAAGSCRSAPTVASTRCSGRCARRGRRGRVDHAREQRGRRDPAVRRDRRRSCASALPRAVLHTDAVQAFTWLDVASRRRGRRPRLGQRAQVRRAEGCRRVRDPRRHVDRPAAARWRTGARPSQRHPERGRHRGHGHRRAQCGGRARIAGRPAHPLARPPGRRAARRAARHRRDGRHRSARPDHKIAGSCHVCFPGVESEALLFLLDQAGHRRVGRVVVHERGHGAVARARRDGHRPRARRWVAAPVVRLADHRGRRGPRARRRAPAVRRVRGERRRATLDADPTSPRADGPRPRSRCPAVSTRRSPPRSSATRATTSSASRSSCGAATATRDAARSATSTTPDASPTTSASITTSSTSATTSRVTWSTRTSPTTRPVARRTRASSATGT